MHLDSKRSSPSLLARQLRLRLVASDDSDIPRNLHNIVVSIHAIATFQALHDYLRPRVSGLLSSGSRLSGMLAALAASGFGPGTTSRTIADELRQTSQSAAVLAGESSNAATAASSSASAPPGAPVPLSGRRRSLRLSAKNAGAVVLDTSTTETDGSHNDGIPEPSISEHPASEASGMAIEPTSNESMIDSGLAAEFTDDEVDAEVRSHPYYGFLTLIFDIGI
jgi:E3 ubiquitin-protein ligase TRIP12